MAVSPGDRAVKLAGRLLELGISKEAVIELLTYPLDQVEAQLNFLPYRKAKRPGAFVIGAIRRNYSAPKGFYYANFKAIQSRRAHSLDQDAEHSDRPPDAETP
jgi:hypothetical protein